MLKKSSHYKTNFLKFIALLYAFVGLSFFCHARQKTLFICLGEEESALHKAKSTGAAYQLNQKLIAKLTATNNIQVKPEFLKQICQSQDFSPSVKFLQIVLLNGVKVFQIPKGGNAYIRNYQKNSVNAFVSEVPHIFFAYLLNLQALTPRALCLEEAIPELSYFFERYKYLETDYTAEHLIDDKSKLTRVFQKLKNLDQIVLNCQKRKNSKTRNKN